MHGRTNEQTETCSPKSPMLTQVRQKKKKKKKKKKKNAFFTTTDVSDVWQP